MKEPQIIIKNVKLVDTTEAGVVLQLKDAKEMAGKTAMTVNSLHEQLVDVEGFDEQDVEKELTRALDQLFIKAYLNEHITIVR
jgi:hypothetical protein